ncbi:MAG TPA: hypothetical protein VGP63_09130 [Planctomycetaceae bacterium]|jgi:hypothetical protein|nr:hypothetical protein [Planctomycetaceae bacterium]
MPENNAHPDRQTERTNRIIGTVVASALLAGGGFLAWQNADTLKGVKLPDRNKLWADTWKKQLSKPLDLPEQKPLIDWSDPKYDPSKLGTQNLSIDLSSYQQGSAATPRSHRRR